MATERQVRLLTTLYKSLAFILNSLPTSLIPLSLLSSHWSPFKFLEHTKFLLASGPLHMLSILHGMLFLQVPSPFRLYLRCYHLTEVFACHLTQTGLSHQLPSHHISCFLLGWLITVRFWGFCLLLVFST